MMFKRGDIVMVEYPHCWDIQLILGEDKEYKGGYEIFILDTNQNNDFINVPFNDCMPNKAYCLEMRFAVNAKKEGHIDLEEED